ncbi:T-cell immunomodulatory protein-like [Antedon mediterranea]|uniref:T-cell immunomodulatory protein-like n=1 Tax=Antedon mediterranea TaxID=105859 RepID=UPI003AF96AF8
MKTRNCISVFINILLIFNNVCGEEKNGALEDNTKSIFGNTKGIIAAYGDFNADQNTDVFVINPAGTSGVSPEISILIWQSSEPHLIHKSELVLKRPVEEVITSVVPGDYDGDSKMDVLVTVKNATELFEKTASTAVYVYWGNLNQFVSDVPTVVSKDMMADQPLVMDYNADMIPDIFGVNHAGERALWMTSPSTPRSFSMVPLPEQQQGDTIRIPHSNAFLDLTSDYATDIFITTDTKFEVWVNKLTDGGGYTKQEEYSLPENLVFPEKKIFFGQSAFTDIDADGTIDHLLPVCFDEQCRESAIFQRKKTWVKIIDFTHMSVHGEKLGFVPPGAGLSEYADLPITMSIGDFNTDRYPDLMIVMRTQNDTRRVVLLNNQDGNHFAPVVRMGALGEIQNPIIASFVDISDNIMLDMFVVSQQGPTSTPELHAVKNNFIVDAYFIRVQVLSGLCFTGCPGFASGRYPYGVNQPGPTVHYETTGTTGNKELSTGAQLSQSAYYSLQIPSVFMGLGQNPNFVDTVTTAIPTNNSEIRSKDTNSIIPNSILIVIPLPPTHPASWDVKLLITPGQSVFLTAGALLGTCLFVAMVIGLLHLKERRQDEKEKRQESHRFHFDAM